jgi:hypothetical protein
MKQTFDKLPAWLQKTMLDNQKKAGNPINPEIFKDNCYYAPSHLGGFNWNDCKETNVFPNFRWDKAINDPNYYLSFFPQIIEKFENDKYLIPSNIMNLLLEQQDLQKNKRDVTIFMNRLSANKKQGGFDWHFSTQGSDFWDTIYNLCLKKNLFQFPLLHKHLNNVCIKITSKADSDFLMNNMNIDLKDCIPTKENYFYVYIKYDSYKIVSKDIPYINTFKEITISDIKALIITKEDITPNYKFDVYTLKKIKRIEI